MSSADASPFFGREDDLRALDAMFASGARVVTLHGPGGVGKTRLARRFATLKGASVFCDLTEARDDDAVLRALAHALGAPGGGDAKAGVVKAARLRGALLVVLDNAEQAIAPIARAAMALLDGATDAALLVTSREPLRLAAERLHPVLPLALPATDGAPEPTDAMRLFVDRARAVRPSFQFDQARAAVAKIVRRLDGLPLAIELAAARAKILDPVELAARLEDGFDALARGPRDAAARQQTLGATIAWSWDLLAPWEQSAFAQASVFRGGFTLEAAQAVIDLSSSTDAPGTLDVVEALVDKSLLTARDVGGEGGALRFSMLETLRAFAAERLSGEARAAALARHAAHYLELGTRGEAKTWHGGVAELGRLALELENLLAVRRRAVAHVDDDAEALRDLLRADIALHPIYASRGPFADNPALADVGGTERALAAAPDPLAARFLLVRGRARQLVGDRAGLRADVEAALAAAQRAGDATCSARALVLLGIADRLDGAIPSARDRFEASLALFESTGDGRAASVVLSTLGALDLTTGNLGRACDELERAVAIQLELGDPVTAAMMQIDLALTLSELGEKTRAREELGAAARAHERAGNRRWLGVSLGYLANLDAEGGALERAAHGYRAALDALALVGDAKFETVFGAARAAVLARAGALADAEAQAEGLEARARAQGEERVVATTELHLAQLDLARAAAEPDPVRAAAHRERAETLRAAAVGLAARSDDVRFALRALDAALGPAPAEAPRPPTPARAVVVALDGAWFETRDGERADLSRRDAARRILLALVRRRVEAPGEPLSFSALVKAGWPGERIAVAAASNRTHVALNWLRSHGLRGVLLTSGGGVLLDRDVPVVVDRSKGGLTVPRMKGKARR